MVCYKVEFLNNFSLKTELISALIYKSSCDQFWVGVPYHESDKNFWSLLIAVKGSFTLSLFAAKTQAKNAILAAPALGFLVE